MGWSDMLGKTFMKYRDLSSDSTIEELILNRSDDYIIEFYFNLVEEWVNDDGKLKGWFEFVNSEKISVWNEKTLTFSDLTYNQYVNNLFRLRVRSSDIEDVSKMDSERRKLLTVCIYNPRTNEKENISLGDPIPAGWRPTGLVPRIDCNPGMSRR